MRHGYLRIAEQVSKDMPFNMVQADKGNMQGVAQGLCRGYTNQQTANQALPGSDGYRFDITQGLAGRINCFVNYVAD